MRVLSSFDVDVPIALGWLRPAVLVPAALVLDLPAAALAQASAVVPFPAPAAS